MGRHASGSLPRFLLAWAIVVAPGCGSAALSPRGGQAPAPAAARELAVSTPAPPSAEAGLAEGAAGQGMAAHPGMRMRHRGMAGGMMGGGGAMGGCAAMRAMGGMRGMVAAGAEQQAPSAEEVAAVAACPAPTPELAAQGKKVFTGKGNCYTCHGPDAKGTPLAPNLLQHKWLNIDGSYAAIAGLVLKGVPQPKEHPAPMPPMGGAALSAGEVCAVAAYVYLLSHKA